MMRFSRFIFSVLGVGLGVVAFVPAVWAVAAVQVQQADGKTLVRATAARLAAWRPAADVLVVVVPSESGTVEVGALPSGVTAEKLAQDGISGVVLQGVDGSWAVVQDGANWLIRPGAGMKRESLLMLTDGWHVGGEVIKPQTVTAAGKQWQVAMMGTAHSVAGSVAGAVRVQGMGQPVASVAAVTAEAPLPVAVKKVQESVKTLVVTTAPVVAPEVVAVPALKPAVMEPVKAVAGRAVPMDGGKVSMEAAPSLRPVAAPLMAASALPSGVAKASVVQAGSSKVAALPTTGRKGEGLQAVNFNEMLARIEPAAGPERHSPVAVELPVDARMVSGLVTKMKVVTGGLNVPTEGGLAKVAVHNGPTMKPIGLNGITAEVLPQILGDIYMPGTLVSMTTPKEEEKARADTQAAAAAAISASIAVIPPSTSWNQTTLEPIGAALAAKAASASNVVSETLAEAKVEAPVQAEEPEVPPVVVNRILPQRNGSYLDEVTDALQAIAVAPDGSTRARDGAMNLAGIYLAWQRPEEALSVLRTLPVRADKLPTNPQARLYMGLAELAKGEVPEVGLFDQGGQLGAHGKLWKAVAASRAGDYATALKLWPQERGIMPQYPAYLREQAQMAQATALVMVGDRTVAAKFIDDLVEAYKDPSEVPVGLVRLRGLARLGTPDETEGLKYLAAAAEDMRDPTEAYRAKFEFVRALQQRHDLSDEQVKKYLTDLWFDWRGDDLEREVLNTLAELYDKAGDSRAALEYWQTLVKAYPKADNLSQITAHMTDAFLKVFDPENPKVYDTLAYLGLYYDFSELVPNDERGDLVQEQVARLLVEANLWNRAMPILEQQLQYRPLDDAARGRLVLLLAEAYGNQNRAADGIKLLDKWEHVATTSVLIRDWKLMDAELMLKLNRPDAANRALAFLPKDDEEALGQRIEATWAAQDWSGTIPLLQKRLVNVPASQLVSDTGAQLATMRLGYAYGQERNGEGLDDLTKRFSSTLTRLPQLADDMGAVAAGTGVSSSIVSGGPLAPLTGAMNDINRLTDKIASLRDNLAAERKQQHEYNDKMRYMELLPPPAI